MIVTSAVELIGNTPIFKIKEQESEIYIKLEKYNCGGSVKDRIALSMIEDGEKKRLINKNTIIVEPTSGNTGIGLSMVGAMKGYKVIIVMPENMSLERIKLIKAYGAEIILTPKENGMMGAIEKANQIAKENSNVFIPMQFENPANPYCHEKYTANEIIKDVPDVDAFVAGVGSGGTFTGVTKGLKKYNPNIKCFAVEPYESSIISGEKPGPHKIQGIGANFIPKNFDINLMDEIIRVKSDDAIQEMKDFAKKHGIFLGISSGCAIFAAKVLAKKEKYGKIVVIAPDSGERYLSVL